VVYDADEPGRLHSAAQFDSTVVVFSGGDNSRQSFQAELYRAGTPVFDGPVRCGSTRFADLERSRYRPGLKCWSAMVPFNLNSVCVSTEGDTLTFAVASGALPRVCLWRRGVDHGYSDAVPPNPGGGPVRVLGHVSATDSTGLIVVQKPEAA